MPTRAVFSRARQAFTIVEILIIVTIIAVLATISIVTFAGMQRSAADMLVQRTGAEAQRTLQAYFVGNRYYPSNIADTDYSPPLPVAVVLYTNADQVPHYDNLTTDQNAQLFLNACNGFMPIVDGATTYNNSCVYNGNNLHVKGTISSNVVFQGPTINQADIQLNCGALCDQVETEIVNTFIQQGGGFPIYVPKDGSSLPAPTMVTTGNASNYCLEARSAAFPDVIYHATPETANVDIGPCPTGGGLHYP